MPHVTDSAVLKDLPRRLTVQPLVMCGGAGTRLWPSSRDSLPKQFAPLLGDRSSFQETVIRLRGEGFAKRPLIVASAAHRHLIDRQLAEIGAEAELLLEPCRRDSGPAIVAGSIWIARHAPASAVLVVAADHLIDEPLTFRQVVLSALPAAQAGRIVTFGIVPSHPATEYGYVEPGKPAESGSFLVARFAEKPNEETAARYIENGFLWNSGNFLFLPETLLSEYRSFHPETVAAVEEALSLGDAGNGALLLDREAMERAEKKSVDYAVMEKTARAAVVKLSCGWSDIGSWDALWSLSKKDGSGNVSLGDTEIFESADSYVSSEGPITALLGVSNLVVVAQRDAVLVADRRRSADVKKIVETLRGKGRSQADRHLRIYCSWGWHQVTDSGCNFELRRISVASGKCLAIQSHPDRTLHWTATSGEMKAIVGNMVSELKTGSHLVIPAGNSCRLENVGDGPAEVIEIQCLNPADKEDVRQSAWSA